MDLKYLQEQVDSWASENGGYWPPLSQLARMTEETGELARAINQVHGPKKVKPGEEQPDIGDELGDIIVTAVCIANAEGIDLTAAVEKTLEKLHIRDSSLYGKDQK